MKQFIVLAAVIPIMLAFVMQFTMAQIQCSRALRAEEIVHNARIEASLSGGFTAEARSMLLAGLAEIYDVPAERIAARLDMADGETRRVVSYEISVPVSKIVAANLLFGISDADNSGYFVIAGEVLNLSEYLADEADS
ncbi:MAG: hypothetical protein LBH63_00690 [Clostridiales Family XIII bacterium]|jgi:hypothetical protein|nr:hypothetical protein [Clostridiales Family XIII bacterium]